MRYIEHIIEPERLLLSWQPQGPRRGRHIVAELRRNGTDADLVYLRDSEEYAQARSDGFSGEYPGFPADRDHARVLAAFMRRLPARDRGDFPQFMEAIRIRAGTVISDLGLLGYAGGKLPGDDFYLIHPFDTAQPPFEFLLLAAGYRHYRQDVPYESLVPGLCARFELEPDNPTDPEAVRIVFPGIGGKTAGYVCRGLLPQFRRWMQAGLAVQATVERRNGAAEHPLIYLYVTVRAQ